MKLPAPSRKVRLALSILFLLFSLVFYWWASGSPMPIPDLARRTSLLSHGFTPGPVEVQGKIQFQELFPQDEGKRWFISRQGDGWAVTVLFNAGPFWFRPNADVYLLTSSEEVPFDAVILQLSSGYLWDGTGENPFGDSEQRDEVVTLVVCTLPDAARVELYQGWYRSNASDNCSPQDWLLEYGSAADCTRLSPDSPFWLCQQVWNPGDGAGITLARAYDAQGNLLCEWCSYDV